MQPETRATSLEILELTIKVLECLNEKLDTLIDLSETAIDEIVNLGAEIAADKT